MEMKGMSWKAACMVLLSITCVILLSMTIKQNIESVSIQQQQYELIFSKYHNECILNKTGKNKEKQRALNILITSMHDGSRLNLPTILSSMGHNIFLLNSKGYRTPYPLAFKKYNFTVYSMEKLSPFFRSYTKHTYDVREIDIMNNYKFYTHDANRFILSDIDVVICSFPSGTMSQIFIPFNKSIFIHSGHRYDYMVYKNDINKWLLLNRNLKYLLTSNNYLGYNKHIISGNNMYDTYYFNYYLNDNDQFQSYFIDNWLPTVGTLYTELYLNNFTINYQLYHHNKTINDINEYLIGPCNQKNDYSVISYFKNASNSKSFQFKLIKQKYHHFESHDLIKHPAIIIFPYAVHSYGITDIYSLNIPIFVPSKKFLFHHRMLWDIGNDQSFKKPKAINNTHLQHYFEPITNGESNFSAFKFWCQKSDFFQWPHFIIFDSLQHLKYLIYHKLKYPEDYVIISNRMKSYNQCKLKVVKQKLSEQLLPIQMRPTPKLPKISYLNAIQQILNVIYLQI